MTYCMRCGTQLREEAIEGRLRDACPACGWISYQHLKVGAGVLVECDGRLLLVQRALGSSAFPGAWCLPAGYCEADEPPGVAAARETAEETGLDVRVGRLFDAYYFDDDPRGHGLLLVYEAFVVSESLTLGDGQPVQNLQPEFPALEVSAAGFFLPDALPEPLCGGGHDRAIGAWRKRAGDRWQPGTAPRYCPQCTAALRERRAYGQQRLACPACGYVHLRELKVGVSLMVEQEGRILLVRRANVPEQGKWCLPSGFCEWDESPEAAARRECLEETGLEAGALELVQVAHYTDDFRGPGINLIYETHPVAGALQAGDDAADARFFASGAFPSAAEIAFVGHRKILDAWRTEAVRPLPIPVSREED